jgi:D-beta-D-heptose 7-phosphate kinase/D-beta-D-heptose 1-phosphate adenosyltransferase
LLSAVEKGHDGLFRQIAEVRYRMSLAVEKKRLLQTQERFRRARLLVIGDVMADHYVWGDVARISPEAPVPVVRVQREELRLGGAANVAKNLRTLGAAVTLCGVLGDDESGRRIRRLLRGLAVDDSGLLTDAERRTIVKTRVIAQHQQVTRVDWESVAPIAARDRKLLIALIAGRVKDFDAVVVSDYAKGVVDRELLDALRRASRRHRVPVAIDPKIANATHYFGFATMTPNHHETGELLGVKLTNTNEAIHPAGRRLRKKLRLDSLVVTRGEEGMTLFFGADEVVDLPTVAREVYDVTGAGDTVIAALACGLGVGANLRDAALLANFAAGVVIAEIGTVGAPNEAVAKAVREAKKIG